MIFNSIDFAWFFLIVFPLFFLLPARAKTPFLLAASYFFYGFWSWKYLALLVATMALDYWLAIGIHQSATQRRRKVYLWVSLITNLGVLFFFKYLNLFSEMVEVLSGKRLLSLELILPFGISFYTFHALSYIIDVYRGTIPAERDFTKYSGYIMFFPQLVAGPIARASHLLPQFDSPKRFRLENIIDGSYFVLRGYVLKVVLADSFGGYVDAYMSPEATRSPWLMTQAVYFFAFQIYCDFCGYTDIARGIARFFDFHLVENFRNPYFATSITDFWRRWHISLSTWLRDYLYISLGGNRKGHWKTYRNLMVTMLLGGLWHGANLTFVVWGGLHGLYLCVEKLLGASARARTLGSRIPVPARMVLTFHLVCLTWIFFRADTFGQAATVVRYLVEFFQNPVTGFSLGATASKLWFYAFLLFVFEWAELRLSLKDLYLRVPWPVRAMVVYALIAFIALFAELNPKAFIYFQF